jgi:hypothetical protein
VFVIDDAIIAAILSGVAGELTSRGVQLLQGDPQKRAFKAALKEATEEFGRGYPAWAPSLFDGAFLAGPAKGILASAAVRDPLLTADNLAEAYADYFYPGDRRRAQIVTDVVPLAADFFLRLDMAMRRQSAFRDHFDSRALDASARYLWDLLRQAQVAWADEQEERVTQALRIFAGAADRYDQAGRAIARERPLADENVVAGHVGMVEGTLLLHRTGYSEASRVRETFEDLVLDRYSLVEAASPAAVAGAVTRLSAGVAEFLAMLAAAPPV